MRIVNARRCEQSEMIAHKSRAVEDGRTGNIKGEVEEGFLSFYFFYVPVFTCMHFVCSLYASLSAYIFVPSALRTRLFSSLYALYAVFFGVMFPHSVHSGLFDAYNAYRSVFIRTFAPQTILEARAQDSGLTVHTPRQYVPSRACGHQEPPVRTDPNSGDNTDQETVLNRARCPDIRSRSSL